MYALFIHQLRQFPRMRAGLLQWLTLYILCCCINEIISHQRPTHQQEELTSLIRGAGQDGQLTQRAKTRRLLSSTTSTSPRDVLAIAMLITVPQSPSKDRLAQARAALRLLGAHVIPTTPCKLYIFTTPQARKDVISSLMQYRDLLMQLPHGERTAYSLNGAPVELVTLNSSEWSVPHAAPDLQDTSLWHATRWGESYRLMGNWRLMHMPRVLRERGHQYVLQIDDDSYVTGPVGFNIVSHMRSRGFTMGSRWVKADAPSMLWGLAELARYFILAEKLVPAQLFEHCQPPNINGLFTPIRKSDPFLAPSMGLEALKRVVQLHQHSRGGFNGTILNGNFVVLDLDFWYQRQVQRWVHLAHTSGGTMRFRWNEQGVQSMVWLLFVPHERFLQFDFPYMHRGAPAEALRAGGL